MTQEYPVNNENLRTLIKSITSLKGSTLTNLKVKINHKYNKKDSLENLTNKLRNKTLKVTELLEILDILNCDLIIRNKNI